MPERFYIVRDDPEDPENHLTLESGSAVICAVTDKAAAHAAIATSNELNLRRHSELSRAEQQRVDRAMNRQL